MPRLRTCILVGALVAVAVPRAARADASSEPAPSDAAVIDAPPVGADAATPSEQTVPSSAPGEESGVRERSRDPRAAALVVPRMILALPEAAIRIGTEPIRLLMMLEDRYHVAHRLRRFFFNDAGTFGIFPTLFFETGFGANAGLRLVHRDLFRRGENLGLRVGFGGPYQQIYTARLDTGERLRRVTFGVDGGYSVTNRSRFYTVGNVDEVDAEDVDVLLDARTADVAVRSRYVERALYASLRADVELAPGLALEVGERIRRRTFGIGSGTRESFPWITDAYAEQTIVGFEGQTDAYGDVHARFERTRSDRPLVTEALPTRGVRADAWGGYQHGIANPYRFGRAGGDLQGWVPLFGGDRVLRLRLRVASVFGEDARIPFVDLPTLGGGLLLRGYPRERFRDRITTLSTVEYQFPVLYRAGAYVFVDAGRVFHDFGEIREGPFRVGYGGGFVAFKQSSFLMAIQVASSIDRGVYVHVNLTTTDAVGDLE